MVSISIRVEDSGIKELLGEARRRMGDLTPAMRIIGNIIRTSVIRNFEVGGRPRWKPLSPVTLARRKGTKVLMRQGFAGGLAGSIHSRAYSDRVTVGTNKVYAATHQFGAKKGSFGIVEAHVREHVRKLKNGREVRVRAHTRRMKLPWGDIPARPFLMVQDEDWEDIRQSLAEYIFGGKK